MNQQGKKELVFFVIGISYHYKLIAYLDSALKIDVSSISIMVTYKIQTVNHHASQ